MNEVLNTHKDYMWYLYRDWWKAWFIQGCQRTISWGVIFERLERFKEHSHVKVLFRISQTEKDPEADMYIYMLGIWNQL